MTKGCYAITFPNGKWYVGSTNNFKKRYRQHKWQLVGGFHANKHMQNCYNKHKVFNFLQLFDCVSEELLDYEQLLLDVLKPELNIAKEAGRVTGWRPSLETKRKISESNSGKKRSRETRLRISLGHKELYAGAYGEKLKQEASERLLGSKWPEARRRWYETFYSLVGKKKDKKTWYGEYKKRRKIYRELIGKRPRRSNGTGHASREALQAA